MDDDKKKKKKKIASNFKAMTKSVMSRIEPLKLSPKMSSNLKKLARESVSYPGLPRIPKPE